MDSTNLKSKADTSTEERATDNRTRSLRSNTRRSHEQRNINPEEKSATTSSAAAENSISDSESYKKNNPALSHPKTSFNSNVGKLSPTIEQDKDSSNEDTQFSKLDVQISKEADVTLKRAVPAYNVPEKIVIAVDIAQDEIYSNFQMSNGISCKPLSMLKHAIQIFLYNKQALDMAHEFALVVLNENTSSWVLDFTSNVKEFMAELDNIEECSTEDIFNLNSLFDVIQEHVSIPPYSKEVLVPPAYVVRVVLFYGRSFTLPQIDRSEACTMLNSPYFTLDVLMTHEPPNTNNHCATILKTLQNLDTKGFAYFFTVARNPLLLLTSTAKLLAHPLQRINQSQAI